MNVRESDPMEGRSAENGNAHQKIVIGNKITELIPKILIDTVHTLIITLGNMFPAY